MTIAGFHLDTDQAPSPDELKMLKNMLLIRRNKYLDEATIKNHISKR